MTNTHKFPYEWTLKGAKFTKDKGKVFSCFSCGGGSTMGYKLAGFDVIGCNEIDPKMMGAYVANHNPAHPYLEPIQTFKDRDDLPAELYELDILDGSPPCSSFSMAGNREKDWGKEKKFREGQADQVLDTLFFDFIELAQKLQPKVVIAENVKGLLLGDARDYLWRIHEAFDAAGYYVGHKLLDASKMGVPQRRERVFFYAIRKDLYKGEFMDLFQTEPRLDLEFDEGPITLGEIWCDDGQSKYSKLYPFESDLWGSIIKGDRSLSDASMRKRGKEGYFSHTLIYSNEVAGTITANTGSGAIVYEKKRHMTEREVLLCSSFPTDYDHGSFDPKYMAGMSVPPVMTAQVATRVLEQWLMT